MGVRFACARVVSKVSTWGLKNVFRRPAANFPGKAALYLDPQLIAHLAARLRKGSVVVVGTNGKTSTTNLLADTLELAGETVICNRTGANLDSGVATALLQSPRADWGVFESDELWLTKILPQLRANYVVLLNLFRDQLDRCGEIDRIQNSIAGALAASPETVLIYNGDDPLCAVIADKVSNRSLAFGIAEDLHLEQNTVADAQMCQKCSGMLEYAYRQYSQLGEYHCLACDFARPALAYAAEDVRLAPDSLSFAVRQTNSANAPAKEAIRSGQGSPYVAYNLLAAYAAANAMGCSTASLQHAIDAFDPRNGRLQAYDIEGHHVLLNLAKNPTGFNQNLKIVKQDAGPKAVAFFVNDKEGDGRDISWLWDVDFEELAAPQGCVVFAGGIRRNDLQVRLKYAGIQASLVENAKDVFDHLPESLRNPQANLYLIANYTALPPVHDELNHMAEETSHGESQDHEPEAPLSREGDETGAEAEAAVAEDTARTSAKAQAAANARAKAEATDLPLPLTPSSATVAAQVPPASSTERTPLVIAHLFPDLLNLYGDNGNVRILAQRCHWRGIPVEVKRVHYGDTVDLGNVDLVFLGGGPDREQRLASAELMRMKDELRAFVEDDGALLAICGGYQILGRTWLLGEETVEGLGIVGMETRRAGSSANRLIDNVVLRSPLTPRPVAGYENHAGRTYLDAGLQAFGTVVSSTGHGNNDSDHSDGVRYKHVIGTYLHGPLLSKNPEVADAVLAYALERQARHTDAEAPVLEPLDDAVEVAANDYLCKRLGV